ncbi:MAG: hypothetical protein EU535_04055 [Promethearchaeota archaeon]|nr:MAG: hypothetical protein EU535_04055 [Candidatus Lokiarchaeota archaeon]
MASKKRFKKKVDVRKKRSKLLKERQKQQPEQEILVDKKKFKTEKEEKLEIRLKKETKLYWVRAITGAISAFIGVSIGLVSWSLFIWMVAFWFGFPFLASFVIFRFKYDEEEWNWKNIIMPGIGIFFFLFMIVAVILYTLQIIG